MNDIEIIERSGLTLVPSKTQPQLAMNDMEIIEESGLTLVPSKTQPQLAEEDTIDQNESLLDFESIDVPPAESSIDLSIQMEKNDDINNDVEDYEGLLVIIVFVFLFKH